MFTFDRQQITNPLHHNPCDEGAPCGTLSAQNRMCVAGFKYNQGAAAGSIGYEDECSPTLTADGNHPPALCIALQSDGGTSRNCNGYGYNETGAAYTLNCLDKQSVVYEGEGEFIVRRLTPTECERLQGFPDGYTACGSDTARYKALGNSMAVPVMRWIGERIQEVERCSGTP